LVAQKVSNELISVRRDFCVVKTGNSGVFPYILGGLRDLLSLIGYLFGGVG